MKIIIEKYNPEWKSNFEKESKLLSETLSESGMQIEHIGSTSVIGLSAKPIIDIMIGLKDFNTAKNHIEAIKNLGYNYVKKYDKIMPYRRFFTKESRGKRTHHLHVVEINSEFWNRLIKFRNHLRINKHDREKYQELKINLAKRDWEESNDFAEAKTEFITKIEEKIIKMFLFKVEDKFEITGKGLVLTPGLGKNAGIVSTGNQIKLIKPDKSEINTVITGIVFKGDFAISIEKEINKNDVPLGTEVWLVNEKSN